MSNQASQLYEFGPFRVDPRECLLLRDGEALALTPKAFETLVVLIQNAGHLMAKDELMKTLWPDTYVEEVNLSQNISILRKALGDTAQGSRYIVTVPGRGYRFTEKVRFVPQPDDIMLQSRSITHVVIEEENSPDKAWRLVGVAVAVVVVAALLGGTWYWRSHKVSKLTEKDSIVIADFANTTGDSVFDGTLRQGLSAQLEQSPFLNLLSDQRVGQTLSLMAQPKDTRLTHELAREVCQRTASAAVLDGSIAQVGTRYLLTVKALDCSTGESLASTEAEASDKNHVLDALGKIASETRSKLGESLASVQKYDVPPEGVTTPSLEALQAYTLGYQTQLSGTEIKGVPLYERAISLDPNFAMAYAMLGMIYFNRDESSLAAENIRKAYELRERVSDREKLHIAASYQAVVTRDFEAARKTYELWTQIYPRDARAISNLATIYSYLGEYDKGLAADQEALRLNPGAVYYYWNLLIGYLQVNRLEDARAIAREAKSKNFDAPFVHSNLYLVEFLAHDPAAMEREAAQVIGIPGSEDLILYNQSDTAAYAGQFTRARELTRRAADSALRSGENETMAGYEAESAVREALVGNAALAKHQAKDALGVSKGRDVAAMSAIALALVGDSADAMRWGDDLVKRFPEDTVVRYNSVPTIRAATALRDGYPEKAIEALAGSVRYEMGQTAQEVTFVLYPVYLRGEADLAAIQGKAAAAEFQKILDHPGLVQNELIGALVHLGLGRAYVLSKDASKARTAYQDFLTLWKDADPDIPILKEAKAEYAKLP
jgi:eukaryotic-like serine/threonine-protein kinase